VPWADALRSAKNASVRLAKHRKTPIRRRGLEKADFEGGFIFIGFFYTEPKRKTLALGAGLVVLLVKELRF
jgi:hypothetical protein